MENNMNKNKEVTILKLEDLSKWAVQDAIHCLHLSLDECNLLGNSENKNNYNRLMLINVFEKYLKFAFSLDD
jgi:hypothetical protein